MGMGKEARSGFCPLQLERSMLLIDTTHEFMVFFLISLFVGQGAYKTPLRGKKAPLIAGVAQLVEHNLAKVGVAGPNPVARSIKSQWEYVMCSS